MCSPACCLQGLLQGLRVPAALHRRMQPRTHPDRVRAARSGAYNRTLTPFGFQAEERTLWQAPQTYITMSPFMQARRRCACVLRECCMRRACLAHAWQRACVTTVLRSGGGLGRGNALHGRFILDDEA